MLNIENLLQAYSNEKSTKKLLKYDKIVDDFNREISIQQIAETDSETFNNETNVELSSKISTELSKTIKEIELERIKYFVKEYILLRLDKIRNNFFLDSNQLSFSEQSFYKEYLEIAKKNGIYVEEPSKEIEIVGFIANRTLEGVKIDVEIVEIYKGDFFVASFDDIEGCLIKGDIHLN